jgi:hypothetical protein
MYPPVLRRDSVCKSDAVLPRKVANMMSFMAVTVLSLVTLYLGTYVADRVETRNCAAPVVDEPRRASE